MTKNEFELRRLALEASNFSRTLALGQHFLTLLAVVSSIYVVMKGLEVIVSHKPEALTALALVIEKLQINSIIAFVVAAGTSMGWLLERRGKQRAYKELGINRSEVEKNDPYHPSSNLDNNGHTPT